MCQQTARRTLRVAGGVLLAALLFLPIVPARAQQTPVSGLAAKYQLAEAYLRAGQFERAVTLLEDLHRQEPTSYTFFDKLREAYVSLKRYDEAVSLVDERSRIYPSPQLTSERASLIYQMGNEEEAYETWDRALEEEPLNPNTYRAVYFAMTTNRLFDRAIDVLGRGRLALDQEDLFRIDLSYLYGLLSEHDRAMEEYAALVLENPNQLTFVKRRLGRFSEQDSMAAQSIPVIEREVRRNPLNRELRELAAWLYMESGAFEKALDTFRAIDRLEGEQGLVLFAFAQEAANAEAFDAARAAYGEILDRYPGSPAAPGALFGMAEIHQKEAAVAGESAFDASGDRVAAPHFDAALATYRDFVKKHPNDPRYPEALQRIGALQQTVFFDLGAAESTLSEVTTRFTRSDAAFEARFNLAQIALQRGELTEARLILSRLEDELEIGELAERARFEVARIEYYEGQFESALAIASALDANTSTDIANDAISLKVLLRENKGPDSLDTALRLYARAELLGRQRRPLQALALLDTLASRFREHSLADEVQFARAEALRATGQLEPAVRAFLALSDAHPESYLIDRALFEAAEIYELDFRDPASALDAYQHILVEYPGSLLAPEVRFRIRRLRGDGV